MTDFVPPPHFILTQSALPGIEVYKPVPEEPPPGEAVVQFVCPQCGATTTFNVQAGGLTCSHCGYYEAPQKKAIGAGAAQSEFAVETLQKIAEQDARGWGLERKDIECQSCGARTSIPFESLTNTCTFCGSNQVIQRAAEQGGLRPRFLIPFKIDPLACASIARQWLGSSWMTPIISIKRGRLPKSGLVSTVWFTGNPNRAFGAPIR